MWNSVKREIRQFSAAYKKWGEDDGFTMAAAVAYYLGLSFFPLLLVLITGIGLFLEFTDSGQSAEQAVLSMVKNNVSSTARDAVREALSQVQDRSVLHGPVALGVMLFSSIAGFVQLQRAFDRIANTPESSHRGIVAALRMVVFERGVAFLMLLVLGLLITAVFAGMLVLYGIERYTEEILPGTGSLWRPVQIGTSFCVNAALFTLIYRWLPKAPPPLRYSIRGGLVAAATWEIGRYILATILIGTKYTVAYGVVGSFIALMLWCYYAVMILLFGAEYIQVVWRAATTNGSRDAPDGKH